MSANPVEQWLYDVHNQRIDNAESDKHCQGDGYPTALVFRIRAAGSASAQREPGSYDDKNEAGYYAIDPEYAQAHQCRGQPPGQSDGDGHCRQQATEATYQRP